MIVELFDEDGRPELACLYTGPGRWTWGPETVRTGRKLVEGDKLSLLNPFGVSRGMYEVVVVDDYRALAQLLPAAD